MLAATMEEAASVQFTCVAAVCREAVLMQSQKFSYRGLYYALRSVPSPGINNMRDKKSTCTDL